MARRSKYQPAAIANCKQCGQQFKYYPACQRGQFCSTPCHSEWRWQTIHLPAILAGSLKAISYAGVRRYLNERDGYRCSECGIDDWNGKPLNLHIDHRDGNSGNHKGANLRYLCPNCHEQQPTSYVNKRFAKPAATTSGFICLSWAA